MSYFHEIARFAEQTRPVVTTPLIEEFVIAHSDLLNRFAARELERVTTGDLKDAFSNDWQQGICKECKCPLSDGHYDAKHDICSIAERCWSEMADTREDYR